MKVEQRSFGGKTGNFESRVEEKHEKLHLKAYLKGVKFFSNGYKVDENGNRSIAWFDTKEIWGERDATKKELKRLTKNK